MRRPRADGLDFVLGFVELGVWSAVISDDHGKMKTLPRVAVIEVGLGADMLFVKRA